MGSPRYAGEMNYPTFQGANPPPGLSGPQYAPVHSSFHSTTNVDQAWESNLSLNSYSQEPNYGRPSTVTQGSTYSLEKVQYAPVGYGTSDSTTQLTPSGRTPGRRAEKTGWSTRRKIIVIGGILIALSESFAPTHLIMS